MRIAHKSGNGPNEYLLKNVERGGEHVGVPVASRHKVKEQHRHEWWSKSDPDPMVSALFEESGEVAPVDFRQFGKRAGEIIAHATRLPHRKPH
jgi:hypothetical protein